MWAKGIVEWLNDGAVYLSIPFTWNLPEAYSRCVWYHQLGYEVYAGGPAVSLMPAYLSGMANIGGEMDALRRHNPDATFTSRGCIRKCKFCAVPKIEGELLELSDWEPRPIVCDNNLLACSRKHFDAVVDRLKPVKAIDFNQGLDARLLKEYHIGRLQELDLKTIRLAWDNVYLEESVRDAIRRLLAAGFPAQKIRCYVLVGFDDTPQDALYRCETLKGQGILPNVQRYQPLDALQKNCFVGDNWTKRGLADFCRYWNRQVWLGHIPFQEYVGGKV